MTMKLKNMNFINMNFINKRYRYYEMVVSYKFPFGKQDFECFIGYKDNKKVRPLCIFFTEMSKCKRYSYKAKCMFFMIKD